MLICELPQCVLTLFVNIFFFITNFRIFIQFWSSDELRTLFQDLELITSIATYLTQSDCCSRGLAAWTAEHHLQHSIELQPQHVTLIPFVFTPLLLSPALVPVI